MSETERTMNADLAGGDRIDAPMARRLRWRCRRGLIEVDLLLERFAARDLNGLSRAEAARLSELLDQPDALLLEWLLGRVSPPAALVEVIGRVRGADTP